jgi:hypothetical protein
MTGFLLQVELPVDYDTEQNLVMCNCATARDETERLLGQSTDEMVRIPFLIPVRANLK